MWGRGVVIIALATGCSTPKRVSVDVAPVNALVPEDLRPTLTFESRELVVEVDGTKARYVMPVPKGYLIMPWVKPDAADRTIRLSDDQMATFLTVGARCDGACGVREWKQTVDKLSFAPTLADEAIVVVSDTTTGDAATGFERRVLITENPKLEKTTITHAAWAAGADRYWTCTFELSGPMQRATAAYVKACDSIAHPGLVITKSTSTPPRN